MKNYVELVSKLDTVDPQIDSEIRLYRVFPNSAPGAVLGLGILAI